MARQKQEIVVGARGSRLSVAQTMHVIRRLKRLFPGKTFVLRTITTLGDRVKDWSRDAKGIFVREIEDALLAGRIDCAVHSLKDMPSEIPDGLCLAAVTRREDPRDVIISRGAKSLNELASGSVVGTTSLRRQAQLLRLRPDLKVEGLRGNLDTRLKKLDEGRYDAVVVARAGLRRLSIVHPGLRIIPESLMIPACGQGALAIESRDGDAAVKRICRAVNDPVSFACTSCERAFLRATGGGCRLPVAVRARMMRGKICLVGLISRADGTAGVKVWGRAAPSKAHALAVSMARRALENGGAAILAEIGHEG